MSTKTKLTRAEKSKSKLQSQERKIKIRRKSRHRTASPFERMWQDGICRVKSGYFTKTIQFQDINYQLNQNEDNPSKYPTKLSMVKIENLTFGTERKSLSLRKQVCVFVLNVQMLLNLAVCDNEYRTIFGEIGCRLQ